MVANIFTNDEESYLYYPDAEMLAFELQADRGNFTYRIEHAQIDTTLGVDFTSNIFLFPREGNGVFTESKVDEFLNAIGSTRWHESRSRDAQKSIAGRHRLYMRVS